MPEPAGSDLDYATGSEDDVEMVSRAYAVPGVVDVKCLACNILYYVLNSVDRAMMNVAARS